MKNCKFISCLLIFVGTIGFSLFSLANTILIAMNYPIREEVQELSFFVVNSAIEAFSLLLLFAGVVILVTEFVINTANKKQEKIDKETKN